MVCAAFAPRHPRERRKTFSRARTQRINHRSCAIDHAPRARPILPELSLLPFSGRGDFSRGCAERALAHEIRAGETRIPRSNTIDPRSQRGHRFDRSIAPAGGKGTGVKRTLARIASTITFPSGARLSLSWRIVSSARRIILRYPTIGTSVSSCPVLFSRAPTTRAAMPLSRAGKPRRASLQCARRRTLLSSRGTVHQSLACWAIRRQIQRNT